MVQVETFEQTEQMVDEDGTVSVEDRDRALEIVERLELGGQQSLIKGDDNKRTLCPYREMTAIEKAVYETLCPRRMKLKEFDGGPIPLRVLEAAEECKDHFDELWVWSTSTAIDPVLVGTKSHKTYSNVVASWWIIARWGDELKPFGDMLDDAYRQCKSGLVRACKSTMIKLKAKLDELDDMPPEEVVTHGSINVFGV